MLVLKYRAHLTLTGAFVNTKWAVAPTQ